MDGTRGVPVGKTIALIAEEGDDISNLEIPAESDSPAPKQEATLTSQSSSSPPSSVPDKQQSTSSAPESRPHVTPSSSRPLFPSVLRLLSENGIEKADGIKGTGIRGMLTKGDVLAHLGKASGPLGTYKSFLEKEEQKTDKVEKKEEEPAPLDGLSIRRLIASNMVQAAIKKRSPPGIFLYPAVIRCPITHMFITAPTKVVDFDDIIADYLPSSPKPKSAPATPAKPQIGSSSYLDGLI